MHPGTILLINGASSSGKTSLLRALQDALEEPFLEAGLDKIIWMMPERYLERPLWDDILGKFDHSGQTGHKMAHALHRMILSLSTNGFSVVADHVLVEPAWVEDCACLFAGLPAYFIGIQCPLEVLEEREKSRRNRTLGQARAQAELVHAHGLYDLEVDTARHSPQECAAQIIAHLRSGKKPQAFRKLKARLK